MASIKSWVSALRPRTLFLAGSTTITGNGLAYTTGHFKLSICILTTLTAIFLQLLSNMANDLGDFQHGTDITGQRIGPARTVQSGAIKPSEMKTAISVAAGLSLFTGAILIYSTLFYISIFYIITFLILGLLSVWAAIKYTTGRNPYGYRGLGDIFSFTFFGPIAVVGTYFLQVHEMNLQPWLPAIGIGLFTAAVLNINNMRDMDNDKNSGKITLAIKLGETKSVIYHSVITITGICCFILYGILYSSSWHWYQYSYMLSLTLFVKILIGIYKTSDKKLLDPYLKQTSIATFILSIFFAFCINLRL